MLYLNLHAFHLKVIETVKWLQILFFLGRGELGGFKIIYFRFQGILKAIYRNIFRNLRSYFF